MKIDDEGFSKYVGFMWEFSPQLYRIFSHMPKNPHKSHMLISYRKYVGLFIRDIMEPMSDHEKKCETKSSQVYGCSTQNLRPNFTQLKANIMLISI